MATREELSQLDERGYFITGNAVDPELLPELRTAARRVADKVRGGQVSVFTHYANDAKTEPLAIRGLLAPQFAEPVFARYLISEPVMAYARALLGPNLRLGSTLLFVNPRHRDWSHPWHRDFDVEDMDMTREQERAILDGPRKEPRWFLALADDACFQLVPGSHNRCRTGVEHENLVNDPHADMPEQLAISLKAGQAIFWDIYSLHRGVMKKDVERLTLNCGWNVHREEEPEKTVDRLKWRLAPEVRSFLPQAMHPYYDRWRALQKG